MNYTITLNISTNRQIRLADGGNIGATCGLQVELRTPSTATDAEIQREIAHHYETATGAMTDQLRRLASQRADLAILAAPANGNSPATGPATGNGKPTPAAPPKPTQSPQSPATPAKALAAPAAPAAPASSSAKPKANGAPKAIAAPTPSRPTPPQPAAQRNAMLAELDRQFAPRDPEPDDDLADDDEPLAGEIVNAGDDGDDDPKTGIELLGWARHQPGDAKQELALIGRHRGFPALIKEWSPTMVSQALQIYRRSTRD